MKKSSCGLVLVFWMMTVLAVATEPAKQTDKRMKPALLVIDIQNEFLPMIPVQEKELALRMINYAIQLFRENGFPVIRIYHTDPQYGPNPETEAFEFPSSVMIKPEDPKIVKNYPNAFKKTGLEKMLREKGCNTLFLCGLSAVACVLATYHGALDHDFNAFMIKDALMSHNSTYTNFVEDIFNAVGLRAVALILENAPK